MSLVSFPSWGETLVVSKSDDIPLNGKGVFCEPNNVFTKKYFWENFDTGYLFLDGKVDRKRLFIDSDKVIRVYSGWTHVGYDTGPNYVFWVKGRTEFKLDRKTLVLSRTKDLITLEHQCRVYDQESFMIEWERLRSKYQSDYDKNSKKNKI